MHGLVAALSAGIVHGRAILDFDYGEDSRAEVDCNVLIGRSGEIIEYQSTAERSPLTRDGLLRLLDLPAPASGSSWTCSEPLYPEQGVAIVSPSAGICSLRRSWPPRRSPARDRWSRRAPR